MKTVLLASVLMSVAPAAAHAQSAQSQSAEELTRLLNGGPPAAARPAPAPAQATTPAPATTRPAVAPASRPAPVQAAPSSAVVHRPAPTTVAPTRAPVAAPPVSNRAPASVPPAVSTPAEAPAPAQTPAAAPSPAALSAAAVAALPFRIELPSGVQLVEGRGAPDAKVWSVRKAGKTLAMIYAGPSSQFPIYDGEQVTAAGRVTVVVPEGARRIAMEHLFQQAKAPTEIHVWLMSLDGADRDVAERIAQSVDPK